MRQHVAPPVPTVMNVEAESAIKANGSARDEVCAKSTILD